MFFIMEIQSKVETLHLDGETHYSVQAKMFFSCEEFGENDMGQLSVRLPEKQWRSLSTGDRLTFAPLVLSE